MEGRSGGLDLVEVEASASTGTGWVARFRLPPLRRGAEVGCGGGGTLPASMSCTAVAAAAVAASGVIISRQSFDVAVSLAVFWPT